MFKSLVTFTLGIAVLATAAAADQKPPQQEQETAALANDVRQAVGDRLQGPPDDVIWSAYAKPRARLTAIERQRLDRGQIGR